MHIYLIGFMGSGKTTIGKQLASRLNYQFLDLDQELEKRLGMDITKMFEVRGELFFRNAEHQLLKEYATHNDIVISTGGGAPCFFDNMDIMNRSGITIYLKADPKSLVFRLKESGDSRPLIVDKTDSELLDFIQLKLAEREKFYSRAQLTVQAINLKASDIITMLQSTHL